MQILSHTYSLSSQANSFALVQKNPFSYRSNLKFSILPLSAFTQQEKNKAAEATENKKIQRICLSMGIINMTMQCWWCSPSAAVAAASSEWMWHKFFCSQLCSFLYRKKFAVCCNSGNVFCGPLQKIQQWNKLYCWYFREKPVVWHAKRHYIESSDDFKVKRVFFLLFLLSLHTLFYFRGKCYSLKVL